MDLVGEPPQLHLHARAPPASGRTPHPRHAAGRSRPSRRTPAPARPARPASSGLTRGSERWSASGTYWSMALVHELPGQVEVLAEQPPADRAPRRVRAGVDQQLEGQRQPAPRRLDRGHRGQVAARGVATDPEPGHVGAERVGVLDHPAVRRDGVVVAPPGTGAPGRAGSRPTAPARRSARPGTGRAGRGCRGRRTPSRRRGRRPAAVPATRPRRTYSRRAGRPPTSTLRTAPIGWRPRRSGVLAPAADVRPSSGSVLGRRLPHHPLQPQHQLGVDRERLTVDRHPPTGQHALHAVRETERRSQRQRLRALVGGGERRRRDGTRTT